MTDLRVDFATLERSATTLHRLRTAFHDLPHTVGSQDSDWGSGAVAGAMHEFATNWDYRREKLGEAIDELGEKIEGTMQAFRDADHRLADDASTKGP